MVYGELPFFPLEPKNSAKSLSWSPWLRGCSSGFTWLNVERKVLSRCDKSAPSIILCDIVGPDRIFPLKDLPSWGQRWEADGTVRGLCSAIICLGLPSQPWLGLRERIKHAHGAVIWLIPWGVAYRSQLPFHVIPPHANFEWDRCSPRIQCAQRAPTPPCIDSELRRQVLVNLCTVPTTKFPEYVLCFPRWNLD